MQRWTENDFLALATVLLAQFIALAAAIHAIMTKRDPRSAAGWSALILLAPLVGTLLYWLLGINRIERKAKKIYPSNPLVSPQEPATEYAPEIELSSSMQELMRLTGSLVGTRARAGNAVSPLENGEEAFKQMLDAIEDAQESILLSTFIFDNDPTGKQFAAKLREAGQRGVKTRVLVDDIGARYSFPTIMRSLRGKNLLSKRFHRVFLPWSLSYSQLRTHRKLLLIDGEIAFIGGMNIREDHLITKAKPKKRTIDIHFKVRGPALRDLHMVFAQDWRFTTKKVLDVESPWPQRAGKVCARVVAGGPRESLGELGWTFFGAISVAQKCVRIATPYFLPDQELISALGAAALRGVKVEILLPGKNNHALAHWACMANLWQVLETGCDVYFSPAPFDHSKLMIVDEMWSFIGSANWDPRSLRLNFELNMECYDQDFAARLSKYFIKRKNQASSIDVKSLKERPFLSRLRNSSARLLIPYL